MFKHVNLIALTALFCFYGCGDSAPDSQQQQEETSTAPEPKEQTAGANPTSETKQNSGDASTETQDSEAKVELDIVDLAGYRSAIAKNEGKIQVVEFWATWCVECKEMLPHTLDIAEKYKDEKLVVMTVSLDEKEDHNSALEFLTEKKAHVVNLRTNHENFDEENPDVFELCDQTLPHVKIIAPDGKVHASFSEEEVTPKNVENAIAELLNASTSPKS